MKRDTMLDRVRSRKEPWDLLVIGGGATGAGIAVDATTRGYETLLVERSDFGQGTSSRSTKLVHGGVRYLRQGNISLVMESLEERGILRQNAPHLVKDLRFVVPRYDWWEAPFYGIGLKIYDLLAGKYGFDPSRLLSKDETIEEIPTVRRDGLRGGVLYHDGQFDDARLLLDIVRTAADHGGCVLNYTRVTSLLKGADGLITGASALDVESGEELRIEARAVVNATGPFCDGVRKMDEPGAAALISPSQGVHIVLDRSFLPRRSAIMVPHTRDGRILFAIPWHGRTLVGTTDTQVAEVALEPRALPAEIDYLLETAATVLEKAPTRKDVLSCFAGIRPLVNEKGSESTASLSRDHTILVSPAGLVTIAGGKWTTYRKMAEDCVDRAAMVAQGPRRPCVTRELRIHGYHANPEELGKLAIFGSDAEEVRAIIASDPDLDALLHERLPARLHDVVHAARFEMARTLEDVLSRRTRSLLLDARAAVEAAPRAATLLARELGRDTAWEKAQVEAFATLARGYVVEG